MKIFVHILLLCAFSTQAQANCNDSTTGDFPNSLVRFKSANTLTISSAWYDGATTRYRHGVLGDAIEPSVLRAKTSTHCDLQVELDSAHVFEDIAPRLAEIDHQEGAEIVTVRSHKNKGAQIAVYRLNGDQLELDATTPYIGTAHRWLAPIGIADFNNDGRIDIALVDRPHLAKQLQIWSYQDGSLSLLARQTGYSNHRIDEDFISGGVRNCDGVVEMITADATWQRILATRMQDAKLVTESLGSFEGVQSFEKALLCQ